MMINLYIDIKNGYLCLDIFYKVNQFKNQTGSIQQHFISNKIEKMYVQIWASDYRHELFEIKLCAVFHQVHTCRKSYI